MQTMVISGVHKEASNTMSFACLYPSVVGVMVVMMVFAHYHIKTHTTFVCQPFSHLTPHSISPNPPTHPSSSKNSQPTLPIYLSPPLIPPRSILNTRVGVINNHTASLPQTLVQQSQAFLLAS